MSRVFIAWSGNFEIAKLLSKKIAAKAGYEAIVGGNLHGLDSIYVGGTIIEQMKKCDQAILLIQKNSLGTLSSNLMFEWGYVLAKLNANKIHNYLINLNANDSAMPSDLHGVWSHSISTDGKSDEEVANELSELFFNSQKNSVNKNKMSIIIDREETRKLIREHNSDPVCSNYEMAQYVLCYIYCANIYLDTRDASLTDLQNFLRDLSANAQQSPELGQSLRCAITAIKCMKNIRYYKDEQYMLTDSFYDLRDDLYDIEMRAKQLAESEVKDWILALVYDFIAYMYLLIINGKELDPEKRAEYCVRMCDYSRKCAQICDKLIEYTPDNLQFCQLLKSYMFRNDFCGLSELEKMEASGEVERSEPTETRTEKIIDCLKKSLKEREALYFTYKDRAVSPVFMNNIEMEYFLALAEYRMYDTDEISRSENKRRLERYIVRAERIIDDRRVFTEKIKAYIKK